MIQQRILIKTLSVNKANQQVYFQIRLPKDTLQVKSITHGVRLNKPVLLPNTRVHRSAFDIFQRNVLFGELQLQSLEQANVFYVDSVKEEYNTLYGDYTAEQQWQMQHITHQTKTEAEPIEVNGTCTLLQGIYQDKIGAVQTGAIQYQVNVYVQLTLSNKKK